MLSSTFMSVGGEDDTLANERVTVAGSALPDGVELVAGRYRIVRWLGAGGMGRVYEAFDTELGERVALKVLRGGLTDDAIERFRREVKLTRRIRHRNVARMHDIGEHDLDKFLTMELIDGAPLAHELGSAMAWPRLRGIATQLCAGLAAAHDAGVIHRDLKPDNVMIERGTDRAVIMDFGIARSGDEVSVTQVGALIGTPRYMAPEQLTSGAVDHRADVFALGVILFELATGARPWSGDNPIAIAVSQATQPPRPLTAANVPPAFAAVVARCIAIDPAKRPRSAALVGEAIASGTVPAWLTGDAADDADDGDDAVTVPGAMPLPSFEPAESASAPASERTTVAVLPVTCAPGDEYLADGLLDDLIDTLSSAGTLRVRPAGVVRSRGELDPRELGRTLEVDHVVVAALRRSPHGLRVVARLISVADGFQIWARRDDCSEAEILMLAEQLGRDIASALSARATGNHRPTDPRAVDLYLRARAELRRFWGDHAQNAAHLLEHAASFAPSSPPILGALAFASVQAWIMSGEPELAPRARDAVERALATGHGEAFLASAVLKLNQGDFEGAAAALGTALVRAPMSAPAHEVAGKILIEIHAESEGRYHLETAIGLDPGRGNVISGELGRLDALQGQWGAADARCRRLIGDPDPSVAALGAALEARLASWRQDRPAMVAAATRFAQRIEHTADMLAFFRHTIATGHLDLELWNQLEKRNASPDRPLRMQVMRSQLMAETALALGSHDLALRALARAAELGLIDITWLDGCPLFSPLTVDLRWRVIRDDVAVRAARVLAAFRSAAGS
jgi:TolB-like protein